jgi:hypothetical protein
MSELLADVTPHVCQRALEALRNGVPNGKAVRVLGTSQGKVVDLFDQQLSEAPGRLSSGGQTQGLLFGGDFGSGKSHLLTYFMQRALQARFVVSRVVISKETPLYDRAKVFQAIVNGAVLPEGRGQVVTELALRLRKNNRYDEFVRWSAGLPPLVAATVWLHERSDDAELQERLREFWAGGKLSIAVVKGGLKAAGAPKAFDVKGIPARDLVAARAPLVVQLARAAGFAGWVVLLDELELMGRYSLMQRARSYAELARWMGHLDGQQLPGLVTVGAITEDYDTRVLRELGDLEQIPLRLRAKGSDSDLLMSLEAEQGMRLIERTMVPLEGPSAESLRSSYERIKEIHALAYGWSPPDLALGELSLRKPMRPYVRRWINEWDLLRLHGSVTLNTEEEELRVDYHEDADLQLPVEGGEPEEA